MEKKILKILDDNKYRIEYDPGKEYDYRVFRGSEDITSQATNLVSAMFYQMLRDKERIAQLEDSSGLEGTDVMTELVDNVSPVKPHEVKMRVQACRVGECPMCGGMVTPIGSPKRCLFCGVPLDWEG